MRPLKHAHAEEDEALIVHDFQPSVVGGPLAFCVDARQTAEGETSAAACAPGSLRLRRQQT